MRDGGSPCHHAPSMRINRPTVKHEAMSDQIQYLRWQRGGCFGKKLSFSSGKTSVAEHGGLVRFAHEILQEADCGQPQHWILTWYVMVIPTFFSQFVVLKNNDDGYSFAFDKCMVNPCSECFRRDEVVCIKNKLCFHSPLGYTHYLSWYNHYMSLYISGYFLWVVRNIQVLAPSLFNSRLMIC